MSRRRRFFTLVVVMWFSRTGSVLGVQQQSATPNPYLFSMDVALNEAEPPVALGIRDGQTVAQVRRMSQEYRWCTPWSSVVMWRVILRCEQSSLLLSVL